MSLDASAAIILILGVVGVQMINELVKLFFNRMRASDFVKVETCKDCQKDTELFGQAHTRKIDAIAKLVLAMAIKMGIDTSEISKLL